MTFKELLQIVKWSNVFEELKQLDKNVSELAYKEIYSKLLSYEPITNDEGMTIHAELVQDEDDSWIDIIGINNKGERYSLSMADWNNWLGYNVNIDNLNEAEFVAHCIWEMTFYGNEEDMINKRDELIRESDKIDKGEYIKYKEDCFICDGTGTLDNRKCICDNGKITLFDTDI